MLSFITIVSGIILKFIRRKEDEIFLISGSLFYDLYVIKIGGDFMMGRLLAGILFFIGYYYFEKRFYIN